MTASDIAFAILCYENGVDVWLERFKMKRMNNLDREAFEKTASLKYHHRPGTKLKAYEDGWTEEGVQYYDEKVTVVKGIMGNGPLWENVKVHWRTYLTENKGVRLFMLLLQWEGMEMMKLSKKVQLGLKR